MTRIAMWSGPRNLSTALMYAFAARGDTAVWDEPFYAAYLARTGLDHPMRDAIIAAGQSDPEAVIARLTGPVPGGKPVFYQKHMCQHMLPGIRTDWLRECVNVFLIRHPARVLASFAAKRENPDAGELGFARQAELFDMLRGQGLPAVVVDSADIRADPAAVLARLCGAIGLNYSDAMLNWPAGGHADDGVWAPVWYGAVHRSTGFAGPEGPLPELSGRFAAMVKVALPHYERLREEALR